MQKEWNQVFDSDCLTVKGFFSHFQRRGKLLRPCEEYPGAPHSFSLNPFSRKMPKNLLWQNACRKKKTLPKGEESTMLRMNQNDKKRSMIGAGEQVILLLDVNAANNHSIEVGV